MQGLTLNAPKWVQYTLAILALLLAAKDSLIQIPGINEASQTLAGQWFDYIGKWTTIGFGIATIFWGKKSNP